MRAIFGCSSKRCSGKSAWQEGTLKVSGEIDRVVDHQNFPPIFSSDEGVFLRAEFVGEAEFMRWEPAT
jgi:hypothetical protein